MTIRPQTAQCQSMLCFTNAYIIYFQTVKDSLNFLYQMAKSSKGLLRLLMLVVVEAIFDTNERLSRCVLPFVRTQKSKITNKAQNRDFSIPIDR